MKAAVISQTGPASVIEYRDLPEPELGPRQVAVRVTAVAVNPIDTYIRAGLVAMIQQFPYVVGCDFAGEVTAVGSAVNRFRVGERVWGSNQGLFGRAGSFAERLSVDEDWVYATADQWSDTQAAAGALVGITAQLGLFQHARLQAGEVLFVNGGTGGVGSAVIQLAKAAGAVVITTAGSIEKRALCRELGADLALDYRDPELDAQIQGFAQRHGGLRVWFETQREPTLDRTVQLLAPRGRIVLMAGRAARPEFPVGPFYVKDLSLHGFAMFNATAAEQQHAATHLNQLAMAGLWKPLIGVSLPLSQAAQAHQLQEDNTLQKQGTLTGKIVLTP